jgi:hypothetical protein
MSTLNKAAADIVKVLQKVRAEQPDVYEAVVDEMNKAEGAPFSKRETFMAKVSEIAARDKLPMSKAMEKAAAAHPDLYEAMQREGVGG